MGATTKVGSTQQTEPADAAAAAAAGEERSVVAAANGQAGRRQLPPGLAPAADAASVQRAAGATAECGRAEAAAEAEPAYADEAIATAAAAAEAIAAATTTATTTAAAASAAAGAPAVGGGAAAGKVMGEVGDGEMAMDGRAEPVAAGKRKRQAVLAARAGGASIDIDEDADVGASLRAQAPSRARVGKQCAGRCAGGRQCGVWSVGSSAPAWLSAPLRSGGQYCTTHAPHRVAGDVLIR